MIYRATLILAAALAFFELRRPTEWPWRRPLRRQPGQATREEASMKFRVNWSIQQDQWLPLYKRWSLMSPQERANEFPEGGKLLGRWHDMAGRTGVLIIESNDLAAVHRWLGRWNPYLDVDLTPVVDDEESAALGR